MNAVDTGRAAAVLEAAGFVDLADYLRADARRDWAVRVLDAWAARKPGLAFTVLDFGVSATGNLAEDDHSERWAAIAQNSLALRYLGPTADAARLAAAEAVWPELPESVRAELGERP